MGVSRIDHDGSHGSPHDGDIPGMFKLDSVTHTVNIDSTRGYRHTWDVSA